MNAGSPISKREHSRRWAWAGLLAFIIAGILAFAYYTGDQANKVATSAVFSIDTTDPFTATNPSALLLATSTVFTIDTTDPATVSNPSATLLATSGLFAIDTTDPTQVSNPLATSWAVSGLFTIDTNATDSSYMVSGLFTIDTTDPALANVTFSISGLFSINTLDPPPEDSNGNGLHDFWELTYFGSLFSAGPDDDPDHDGMSNFMEFAFGLDPTKASGQPISNLEKRYVGGVNYLYFTYTRHILAAQMVKFTIGTSSDLSVWTDAGTSAEELDPLQNINGSVEVVTVRIRLAEPQPSNQFIRFKVQPK